MQLAEYVFSWLAEYGVRDIFMVSGGGAMFLNNALGHEKRIQYICNHHEQAAAIAAEGYARVTNKLGVALVTTGPGGTNSLTGVIGEWLDSIPALFISGQVKFQTTILSRPDIPLRQLGDQEINIVDIVKPVTKYAVTVTDPVTIRYHLEKAVWFATHGRKGPAWIDIPINVQMSEIQAEELMGFEPSKEDLSVLIHGMKVEEPLTAEMLQDSEILDSVVEKIAKAKAPVILAGNGIRLGDALPEFHRLVHFLDVPVLMSFNGFDLLPSSEKKRIGSLGTIGVRGANIVLQSADCVLSLGTRNNIRQTSYNYENYAKNAKDFIVVDVDSAELKKGTVVPTLPIHADVKVFLTLLLKKLEQLDSCALTKNQGHLRWLKWAVSKKERYSPVLPEYEHMKNGVQPYWFTKKLTELLKPGTVLGCANATPSITLFQSGIVKENQRFFCNSGCAAMGYGLPAAIGAAFAAKRDGRPVICLEGDGSLMMNLQEMQTVTQYGLPLKLFLFNNGEYASIRQTHDNFFDGFHTACDPASGVSFPDWKKVAAAFEWEYREIHSNCQLEENIREVLEMPGPVFCDVKLVPNYTFAPKLSSRRMQDGTIQSASLEDMFPFLPEEEMKTNYYHPENEK